MRKSARAFAATRYSIISARPASVQDRSAITWMAWDNWAKKNSILGKNGKPSRSKVETLVKCHILSATKSKCIPTFHSIQHGKAIYRNMSRFVVTERFIEQIEWKPEEWQAMSDLLYSKSQSTKAKKKRKR
jgi:hypothetical protein